MEAQQELAITQETETATQSATETEGQVTENTGATGATEAATNDAETDEQKNARAQQEAKDKQEKRSRGVQKRMDELTRDKYAERQAREAAEKRNDELIALIKGGQSPAKPADAGQPKPEQYADYQEYVRADAIWHAEQRAEVRAKALVEESLKSQREEQQRSHSEQSERSLTASYVQRQNEIAKTIPDFHQVMEEGAENVTVPTPVFNMMKRMSDGPLIAYHMAKNPGLAEQFALNPPEMHGILLGQLSATLKGSAKVSNAPPPGKPARASTGSATEPPEDTAAYFAWADKHMR